MPPPADLHTRDIIAETIRANRLLGELRGYCQTLPDPAILLNTVVLQESKESSAIENVVTTQDELYQAALQYTARTVTAATKEVIRYREAMYWGFDHLKGTGLITTNMMIGIMQRIKATTAGIRTLPGTRLASHRTNETLYTPPDVEDRIRTMLAALEQYINVPDESSPDPLIRMALIHYQFEAIHPFPDGNGRTGRILNVLYLIHQGLIDLPVLYLSQYFIRHKDDYYRLLREVSEEGNWAEWVLYVLRGVSITASHTLKQIAGIMELKRHAEAVIRSDLKASQGRELTDLLFSHPYIKINVLVDHGIARRETASKYLHQLADIGLLKLVPLGRDLYFINTGLMNILNR